MKTEIRNLCGILFCSAFCLAVGGAYAASSVPPRENHPVQRGIANGRDGHHDIAIGASSVKTRSANPRSAVVGRTHVVTKASPVVVGRSAVGQKVVNSDKSSHIGTTVPRSMTKPVVARTAFPITSKAHSARSAGGARTITKAGISRAASARATALFNDISKIGGGYAQCREAISTCLDQFCGNANDEYRRCFCSSRFADFRDQKAAFDQAKTLLLKFQDNNLNAVDKSAAEVNAMYSATEGEKAIKKDTSGAAKMLAEVNDLLSGKKAPTNTTTNSLGILDLDFSTDVGDVWGESSGSIFNSPTGKDMSGMEGQALYNEASKQCLNVTSDSCENNAILNMAMSSYSILISQDCNAYEKSLNKERENIKQIVRTAEKYLRDARLEEYHAHNTDDVNKCMQQVKDAITADTACGSNYERCLDYTGAYINPDTGDPIYSRDLFNLANQIELTGGSVDVLNQNSNFNKYLDSKKLYAKSALDSCRNIADTVWNEFKRSALIEIAQAQDAKIEEVKMSCVSTMAQCYNTQSNALKDFDETTAQSAGALSAYAAKEICRDKVVACAALYDDSKCQVDSGGHIENAEECGLPALLEFVNTVDETRVAEGCATTVENYLKDKCTLAGDEHGYPWNCHQLSRTDMETDIRSLVVNNCGDPSNKVEYEYLPGTTKEQGDKIIGNLTEQMQAQFAEECRKANGFWINLNDDDSSSSEASSNTLLVAFYNNIYGSGTSTDTSWGKCVENTTRLSCLAYNDADSESTIARYNEATDECEFGGAWYAQHCQMLNGYYSNGICYAP